MDMKSFQKYVKPPTHLVDLSMWVLTGWLLLLLVSEVESVSRFDEEVFVRPVLSGTVVSYLFTTTWDHPKPQHYNLFPKFLGQMMEDFGVEELRLGFSKGEWESDAYGMQFSSSSASGVELSAVFVDDADTRWNMLTRSISTISCTKLDSIAQSAKISSNNSTIFYAQFPSQASCTENLTPWLALLPCRGNAGLAKSIIPRRLFSADYHAFNVHFKRTSSRKVELVLSLTAAFRHGNEKQDLLKVLGVDSIGSCPMASSTSIISQSSEGNVKTTISENSNGNTRNVEFGSCSPSLHVLDVKQSGKITSMALKPSLPASGLLAVTRHGTGYGSVRGGVVTTLRSRSSGPLLIRYLEMVPFYLRVLPTSISVAVNGVEIQNLWQSNRIALTGFNERSTTFQFHFDIPPRATVVLKYSFKQAFLPLGAFPPDPNRGFDIPAASITYEISHDELCSKMPMDVSPFISRRLFGIFPGRRVRAHTNALLIAMPLPDFSMPYNVITLSSTCIGYFIGSLISLVTKPFDLKVPLEDESTRRRAKIKSVIKNSLFAIVLGTAWLFENQRDTFDEMIEFINTFSP